MSVGPPAAKGTTRRTGLRSARRAPARERRGGRGRRRAARPRRCGDSCDVPPGLDLCAVCVTACGRRGARVNGRRSGGVEARAGLGIEDVPGLGRQGDGQALVAGGRRPPGSFAASTSPSGKRPCSTVSEPSGSTRSSAQRQAAPAVRHHMLRPDADGDRGARRRPARAPSAKRSTGPAFSAAARAALGQRRRQEVHRRAADEAGDIGVGRARPDLHRRRRPARRGPGASPPAGRRASSPPPGRA